MTHIGVVLDDSQMQKLHIDLQTAAKGLRDYRKAWRRLTPYVALELKTIIVTQGRSAGLSWPALKQATLRKKKDRGGERAALQMTGRLMRAVGSKPRRSLSRRSVTFSAKEKYQFVQNFGSKRRGIPAREFLVLTPRMIQMAEKRMLERIDEVLSEFARG